MRKDLNLSRRERQIMDILHARRETTAAEVHQSLPDAPSYSAVRALLRILEEKGHIRHRRAGLRYVFLPVESREQASRSALQRVLATFFGGSVDQAVAALLEASDTKLSDTDLDRLQGIITKAKEEGR
jgi:BlaI family penicillinase repressor